MCWEADSFDQRDYRLSADREPLTPAVEKPSWLGALDKPAPPVAVVSGGGDGALQDLQRLVFTNPGRQGRTFWTKEWIIALERAIMAHVGTGRLPALWGDALAGIDAAERQFDQALS